MPLISRELIRFARQEFRLDWRGIHGAPHWARVRHNGLQLANLTGANPRVVEYFAFIHDLGRENDFDDPEHGYRAAEIARDIAGDLIQVTSQELDLLVEACEGHSEGHMVAEVTVMTCWDADRLDLGRVGVIPEPDRLCNVASRNPEFLRAAFQRSTSRHFF